MKFFKHAFFLLALLLAPALALGQNVVSGNITGSTATSGGTSTLTTNHIFVGNASNVATDVAMSQDCAIVAAGTITCTKTNNVAFTSAATTAIGTSGATIPLLNTANTWGAAQTFTNSDLLLLGSSTGATTFTSANAGASNFTITVPAATDTIALLGTAQTFTVAQTIQSASASALAVGRLGATTPAFSIDASTASQVAGLNIKGAATGGTVVITTIDSGSNTNLTIDGKGNGTIGIGTISTGTISIGAASSFTSTVFQTSLAINAVSSSATSLAVGRLGTTNPAFVVDSSTGSQAAGLKVTGAATGGTVAVVAIDSGSNTNLTINAKGTGTIGLGTVSTGNVTVGNSSLSTVAFSVSSAVTINTNGNATNALSVGVAGSTNPAFQVAGGAAAAAAGFKITGATSGGTVAMAAIDSGSNTSITFDAKGTGTIGIGTTSTGQISLGASSTVVSIVSTAPLLPNITTGTNADFLCRSAGGAILLQTSSCTISSARFKQNIVPLDRSALDMVEALNPVSFRMKEGDFVNPDPNFPRTQLGLIAENVEAVDPRMAIYENDLVTPKSYRQESVIAVLVGAVQELHSEVEELKHRKH